MVGVTLLFSRNVTIRDAYMASSSSFWSTLQKKQKKKDERDSLWSII